MKRLTPDAEQERDIELILTEPTHAALDASDMGTGKTLVACEVIIRAEVGTALIICPLGVRVNFERTLRRQGYAGDIRRIDGKQKGKAAFEDLKQNVPGVYLIGREYFRLKDWNKIRPDIVVFDEVHAVSNRKTLGFKQLKNLKPKRLRLGMSGTPSGNRFEGMWAVTRWLWPDLVERSFWRWAAEWTKIEEDWFAGKQVVGEKKPGAYVKNLPCYLRRESSLDVEYVEEVRLVELTPTQRKIYRQMEEEMVMWLEENPSVAAVPVVQRVRLRQITLGVPTLAEDGSVDFKPDCTSSKIDALKEIIKDLDPGEPLLILTDSSRFAKVVANRLGDKAGLWTGDQTQKQRDETKAKFIDGSVQWLVATIAAIGEGVDELQTNCNHVVWLSRSENRILNEQAQARLHRTGQQKHVYGYDIQALDTYDSGIFQRLELQKYEMHDSLNPNGEPLVDEAVNDALAIAFG